MNPVLFSVVSLFGLVVSKCPHDDVNLKLWSEEIDTDEDVVINPGESILLNTSPPPLRSITIEKGGKLVVNDDVKENIHLQVKFILVRGELHIGSESCKFKATLQITLYGDKNEYSIPGFGEKFIGVEAGGVLEIHGEDRLPWTKLTKTVPKVEYKSNMKNIPADKNGNVRALVMYVFNENTGEIESADVLFTGGGKIKDVPTKVQKSKEILEAIPDGRIVAVALKRRMFDKGFSEFCDMFEKWAYGSNSGQLLYRNYEFHDAWALIKKQGDDASTKEHLIKNDHVELIRIVDLYHEENGLKFGVRSWVHTIKRGQCYTRGKASPAEQSLPVLTLVDDVSSWRTGDTVALLSTDYDWKQAEFGTVVDCETCEQNQVRVDVEPAFEHYGEIYKNVDMRGEVALVNRNIVIHGRKASNSKTLGGHIKFLKGFSSVNVQNIELTKMGQLDTLGNYPLHFHMCADVDTNGNPPIIRGNSIHHTHARCITVHGTHGVQVLNNFCFDSVGHGYFLEDGGEKRTVFDGNLGAGQRKNSKPTRSDKSATTFWLTNPKTYVRNNVAAGGEGHGYWFIFPSLPLWPSNETDFMELNEAKHTAIYEFDNNVAHSYVKSGLFIDFRLKKDGSFEMTNEYEPWVDPKDSTSGDQKVVINRLTAYKNMKQNAWINGGFIEVTKSSFSDSIIGLTFKRSSPQMQFLTQSVFIGESPNIGSPSTISSKGGIKTYPRSVPLEFADQPRQGFVFYHGPVYVMDTWFGDFASTDNYNSGALGLQRDNLGFSSPISSVSNLGFGFSDPDGGNRVFDGNSTDTGFSQLDGDVIGTFRDLDGSVYKENSQIVKPLPFHTTASCEEKENWKMTACPFKFSQIKMMWGSKVEEVFIRRDDIPDDPILANKFKSAPFMAITGNTHSYLVNMNGDFPTKNSLSFKALGLSAKEKESVRLAVCVPKDSNVMVLFKDYVNDKWTKSVDVDDLDALDESTSPFSVYKDSSVGVVFFKMMHTKEFADNDVKDCEWNDTCPSVKVRIIGGTASDSDCTDSFYKKYKRTSVSSNARRKRSTEMPYTSLDPPKTWGAGDTRPVAE